MSPRRLAALVLTATLLGAGVSSPAAGQARPAVAGQPRLRLAVEPCAYRGRPYLRLFAENHTDAPVELTDDDLPAWTAEQWFSFKVNGKRQEDVRSRGVFTGRLEGPEVRVFPPQSRTFWGAVACDREVTGLLGPYTPLLELAPGTYNVQVSGGGWRGEAKHAGLFRPAKFRVTIPEGDAEDKGGAAGDEGQPFLWLTRSRRKDALEVTIYLANPSHRFLVWPHEGRDPLRHPGPWFRFEVDGKPAVVEVLGKWRGQPRTEALEARPQFNWVSGHVVIPLAGWSREDHLKRRLFDPVLRLSPGRHTVRVLPSARWDRPGGVAPEAAAIVLEVPKE
jgi:hypothetical protein